MNNKLYIENNIFLLGNGFDLHYNLPTSYSNFLNTVKFLKENYNVSYDTVGKVFSDDKLQKIDSNIRSSYEKYKSVYDVTLLNSKDMNILVEKANENPWFNYLSNSLDQDKGWIDFEKEIALIIKLFNKFFSIVKGPQRALTFKNEDRDVVYVMHIFDFFIKKVSNYNEFGTSSGKYIDDKYIYEVPKGSKKLVVDKSKIAKDLYNYLLEFTDMLNIYLRYFVDNILDGLVKNKFLKKVSSYDSLSKIVTFNYTHTFEAIYPESPVYHIHGEVDKSLVLGVNSDSLDEIENLDTTFLSFKKYYQKVFYNTDRDYNKMFESLISNFTLYVIGHSLDITDRDTIKELFSKANKININYHNDDARSKYINNLISMYGKAGFEKLRLEKDLKFVKLI